MEVVADIISAHDNIKVVNQPNQGFSVALNAGLNIAKNEYILFNDPDGFFKRMEATHHDFPSSPYSNVVSVSPRKKETISKKRK